MTSRFLDKFARVDGAIGSNYTVPCGGVLISDEAVIPIDAAVVESGFSPLLPNVTARKTQVFYTAQAMDGSDYVVRGTWAHDGETPSAIDPDTVNTDCSFTLLARMSKDPLLYDLGTDESPDCFDQGYGARVTMPLDGTAPILKIIKFMPLRRLPNLNRPASAEVDGMVVLASVTLDADDLNLSEGFDASNYSQGELLPYKGIWQDMRLRIRRADSEVILDVYLNDRNLNQAKLSYTDKTDPLWGEVGLPGFEFLSGTLVDQPAGVSPFSLTGLSLLRCGIFSVETFADIHRPVHIFPGTHWTYERVVNRVILLVEKNGDARYNATTSTQTKFDTYLDFVLEAEADIIRREGYWQWLRRFSKIYLSNGVDTYELPENMGELETIRPGNWNGPPLREMDPHRFYQILQGAQNSGGQPNVYIRTEPGPNNRMQVKLFPTPVNVQESQIADENPFLIVDYYARQLRPYEPETEIPFVPQEDIDVLVYAGAAHALILDTDNENSQRVGAIYAAKSKSLMRKNNRNINNRTTKLVSAADLPVGQLVPLTRAASLNTLLYI